MIVWEINVVKQHRARSVLGWVTVPVNMKFILDINRTLYRCQLTALNVSQ